MAALIKKKSAHKMLVSKWIAGKNSKVIIAKNTKMALSSTNFGNFLKFEKCQFQKLENFKKWFK